MPEKKIHWLAVQDQTPKGKKVGTAFQVTVDFEGGPESFTFERKKRFAGEAILTMGPVNLTAEEWDYAIDVGNGGHASSSITRARSTLGRFISYIEDQKLQGKQIHPQDWQQYQFIKQVQQKLKKFYEQERNIDPNDSMQVEGFKREILLFLNRARAECRALGKIGRLGSADHAFAAAEKAVRDFAWPLCSIPADGTSRKAITKGDQLIVEPGTSCLFDPALGNSSAVGAGLMPHASGIGPAGKRAITLMIINKKGFPKDPSVRRQFRNNVNFLISSESFTPATERLWRKEAHRGYVSEADSGPMREGIVCLAPAPVLEARAKELALLCPAYRYEALVTSNFYQTRTNGRFNKFTQLNMNARLNILKTALGDEALIQCKKLGITARAQQQKAMALALYHKLTKVSATEFNKIKEGTRTALHAAMSPYKSFADVTHAREIQTQAQQAQATYTEALEAKIKEKLLEANTTQEKLKAIEAAIKECEKDKVALEEQLKKLSPNLLVPDAVSGPEFLRHSLASWIYTIGSAITTVLEDMGLKDPIFGAMALVTLLATFKFSLSVAAHKGSVAAAEKASELTNIIGHSYFIPWVVHGGMAITPHMGGFDTLFASFINAVVAAKLQYILMSGGEALAGVRGTFTGELLNGVANYPVETAILLASLAFMGHVAVHAMGEAHSLGSWKLFDETTSSMKPAAIAFDVLAMAYAQIKGNPEIKVHPSCTNTRDDWETQLSERMAKLFCQAVQSAKPANQADLTAEQLAEFTQIMQAAFAAIPATAIKAEIQTQLQAAIIGAASLPEWAKTEASRRAAGFHDTTLAATVQQDREFAQQLTAARPEISEQELFTALTEAKAAASITHETPRSTINKAALQAFVKAGQKSYKKALHQQATNINTLIQSIPGDSVSPLNCLTAMYPKQATDFDAGVAQEIKASPEHSAAKLTYLQNFFQQDLLKERHHNSHCWHMLVNSAQGRAFVKNVSGASCTQLMSAQTIPTKPKRSFAASIFGGTLRTLRGVASVVLVVPVVAAVVIDRNAKEQTTADRWNRRLGRDDFAATVYGGVRLLALPFRVLGTAAMTLIAGPTTARGRGRVIDKSLRGARRVKQGYEYATDIRPTGVAYYRKNYSAVVLLVKPNGETPSLKISGAFMKRFIDNYKKLQSFRERWVGKNSHIFSVMQRQYKQMQKASLNPSTNMVAADGLLEIKTLDLLKTMFPRETVHLKKLMAMREVPAGQQDNYLLASLQRIFRLELQTAHSHGRKTFKAFSNIPGDDSRGRIVSALAGCTLAQIEQHAFSADKTARIRRAATFELQQAAKQGLPEQVRQATTGSTATMLAEQGSTNTYGQPTHNPALFAAGAGYGSGVGGTDNGTLQEPLLTEGQRRQQAEQARLAAGGETPHDQSTYKPS